MPNCKNCGSRLTKFDKDRCPVCGFEHPLDGVSSETVEITSQIDINTPDYKNAKIKKRKTFLIFSILLGFTGLQFFYLGYKKWGIITLFSSLILIVGLGALLYFVTPLSFYSFLFSLSISYLINIILGIIIFFDEKIKDAYGGVIR